MKLGASVAVLIAVGMIATFASRAAAQDPGERPERDHPLELWHLYPLDPESSGPSQDVTTDARTTSSPSNQPPGKKRGSTGSAGGEGRSRGPDDLAVATISLTIFAIVGGLMLLRRRRDNKGVAAAIPLGGIVVGDPSSRRSGQASGAEARIEAESAEGEPVLPQERDGDVVRERVSQGHQQGQTRTDPARVLRPSRSMTQTIDVLNPTEIARKQFSEVPVGYSIEEVRAFLTELALSYARVVAELLSRGPLEDEVASPLDAARRHARSKIAAAREKADEIRSRATAEAILVKRRADAAAIQMHVEAQRQAARIVDEAIEHVESETGATNVIQDAFNERVSRTRKAREHATRIKSQLDETSSALRALIQALAVGERSERAIRILIVCTVNRCRSPAAAAIFDEMLWKAGCEGVEIYSRGTEAGIGWGPPTAMLNCLGHQWIDVSQHRSRPLRLVDIVLADVVVVMERRHAEQVRALFPSANVVLLGQIRDAPRFQSGTTARERLSLLLEEARRRQAVDISDPSGARATSYQKCIDEMTPYLRVLADTLIGIGDLAPITNPFNQANAAGK